MRQSRDEFPAWFLWLWDKGLRGVLTLLVVLAAIVCTVAFFVDRRLDRLEQRLTYEPPGKYELPNLTNYAAPDFDESAIVERGAFYVPIYSHVYAAGGHPYLLEATLSIRNTNVEHQVFVRSVRYYDTTGELEKTYVDKVIRLDPLETLEFVVEHRDTTGGSGANFIVEWAATEQVDVPIVDAVMVGITGTQAFSFSRAGVPVTGR